MNKIFYALITLVALTSCASSYDISGTSNVSTLDGRMLYLQILKNNEFSKIDSCDVVHGQFHFQGTVDSARMANVFMDDEPVLPLVLEAGSITVKLDDVQQVVSGTPLNDKLFGFFKKYQQLQSQQRELVHKHDQAIMNGSDMNVVTRQLTAEANRLAEQEDKLVTTFVTDNFDNVLGAGVFFLVTMGNQYPMLTPWIEDIMSKATDHFKNDSYVKDYYQKAQENEQIMNAIQQLLLMLLLGVVLVYLIMVAQFQSLKAPFIVMFTIPLAFTGGFLALLLSGIEVSVISLIGFVMLVGIIVNNGIVLVDYINQQRLAGMGLREAIIDAGVTRLRPILMTSLTTILGLIVTALAKNAGTALIQPIALVCIGGLLYATLMTLFVVPCMYEILNKKELHQVAESDLTPVDM